MSVIQNKFEPNLQKDRDRRLFTLMFFVGAAAGLGLLGFAAIRFFPVVPLAQGVASTTPQAQRMSAPEGAFICEGNRWVKAVFLSKDVALSLSDGRQLTLPQVVSASGVRYANPDGSFVFRSDGNTASIEEDGVATYANCVI